MKLRALPPLVLFAALGVWACGGRSDRKDEDGGEAGEGGAGAGRPTNPGGVSGTSSGGVSGASSGGTATGGRSGAPSGGTSTGGVSGTASGGTTTGGASTAGTSTGGASTGGSSTGGGPGTNTCPTCTPQACTTVGIPTTTINDFDDLAFIADGDPTVGLFGILDETGMMKTEWWLDYFSGSYAYPVIPQACSGERAPAYPLTRNEMTGVLRVTGTVGGPSGFGIWLGPCIVNMSGWNGVSFTIGGRTGTGFLEMKIGTSSNTDPDACQIGRGKCTTDVCQPPSFRLPIPGSAETIFVPWTAFNGGLPAPGVDPGEVLEIRWDFEWASGMTPYPVDVTLDNVMLFE